MQTAGQIGITQPDTAACLNPWRRLMPESALDALFVVALEQAVAAP